MGALKHYWWNHTLVIYFAKTVWHFLGEFENKLEHKRSHIV